MRRFRCRSAAVLALSAALMSSRAEADPGAGDPVALSREHYRAAVRAYRAHDFAAFRDEMRASARLRPDHPGLQYNLAAAYALTAAADSALAALGRFAVLGAGSDPAADSSFAALWPDPRFRAAAARIARNREPVGTVDTVFTFPVHDLIAESVVRDPADGAFYVSSVHHRKIVRVAGGAVSDFVEPGADGLWGAFGMKIDGARKLYVATSALAEASGVDSTEFGRAGVFRYDLASGRLERKILLPPDGRAHLFGDLAPGPRGEVYVTDSLEPDIYVIPAGADTLIPLVAGGPFSSLQGIVYDSSRKTLFVSDYSRGLFRVDPASGTVAAVPGPRDATLIGTDGLYLGPGGALIGVQNGLDPTRIARMTLNATSDRVIGVRVLLANRGPAQDPALGAVAGDRFYFLGRSGWSRAGRDGALPPPGEMEAPILLELTLPPAR